MAEDQMQSDEALTELREIRKALKTATLFLLVLVVLLGALVLGTVELTVNTG